MAASMPSRLSGQPNVHDGEVRPGGPGRLDRVLSGGDHPDHTESGLLQQVLQLSRNEIVISTSSSLNMAARLRTAPHDRYAWGILRQDASEVSRPCRGPEDREPEHEQHEEYHHEDVEKDASDISTGRRKIGETE
jgi:hypothetical protein